MTARRFIYRAVSAAGAASTRSIIADSRAEALTRLTRDGATIIDIREEDLSPAKSGVKSVEAVLVLKQLSVMTRAGIDLLEALETIASSLDGRPVAAAMRSTAISLRQGQRLASALKSSAPFFPPYVYALIRAGESSGRLPQVLEEASRQLEFENRTARDVQNALVYPAFLVISGAASVAFLFYVVVPRFAEMLRNARADLHGLSAFVIDAGVFFHDNAAVIVTGLALAIAAMFGFANTTEGKNALSALAHAVPGLRQLLLARQRTAWSRIMALALGAGVDILQATALAAEALPEGRLKQQTLAAIPALRAGRQIDDAFAQSQALTRIDASLVRAGQRASALPQMFQSVAERNEAEMRDALKRFTLVLEPIAIAVVALMIGAIVLGLVSALAGVYDSIG